MSRSVRETARMVACIQAAQQANEVSVMESYIVEREGSTEIVSLAEDAKALDSLTLPEIAEFIEGAIPMLPQADGMPLQVESYVNEIESIQESIKAEMARVTTLNKALPSHEVAKTIDNSMISALAEGVSQSIAGIASITAKAERNMAVKAITLSLENLGFATNAAEGQGVSAIEAHRGHETRLIVIEDGLNISRDTAGLGDESCIAANQAIIEECKRNGLYLKEIAGFRHDDIGGGTLISTAGRHNPANLAEGYLASKGAAVTTGGIYGKPSKTRNRTRRLAV